MNILILAAGESEQPDDDRYPVWLSEVDGQLVLERQIKLLTSLQPSRFLICVRSSDNEAHHVSNIVKMISPLAETVDIKRKTSGAACTALLAIGKVNFDEELLIVNATDHLNIDCCDVVERFRNTGADGGVVTFESLHPRYSYVRLDDSGDIVEVAEKRPISRMASTGFYWLRNAGEFFSAMKSMVLKDAQVSGLFYVAPALNEMILKQKSIKTIQVEKNQYIPIKSSKQLMHYEHLAEENVTI